MKNLKISVVLLAILLIHGGCSRGIEPSHSTEIDVELTDEKGKPLVDGRVELFFYHLLDEKAKIHRGQTDSEGRFSARDKVVSSVQFRARKAGFYGVEIERLLIRSEVDGEKIRNFPLPIVMRRILEPRALLARKVNRAIPEDEKWIGFDLKVGDWVGEYGDGRVADFEVRFKKKFVGLKMGPDMEGRVSRVMETHKTRPDLKASYFEIVDNFYEKKCDFSYEDAVRFRAGKWEAELEFRFSGRHEGILEVVDEYHSYSGLKMPNSAPDQEYRKTVVIEGKNHTAVPVEEKGYFLRVREQTDENGELVSANYAKFFQALKLDPRGRIEFSYAFNPDPNDRNLEFDSDKNLFTGLEPNERVREP